MSALEVVVELGHNYETSNCDVHRPGCRDLHRETYGGDGSGWLVTVSSLREIVDAAWGPNEGSFYSDAGLEPETAWLEFVDCTRIMPCAREIVSALVDPER